MTNAEQKAALLRAVVLDPDTVTPRLILADWLEEYGSALERESVPFIRAEYVPAKDLVFPTRKAAQSWKRYTASLLSGLLPKSYALWLREWPSSSFDRCSDTFPGQYGNTFLACARPVIAVTLRHGFVENISAPRRWFRKNAARLFASQPFRCVVLHGPEWCPNNDADTNFFVRGRTSDWNYREEEYLPPEIFDRLRAPLLAVASRFVPAGAAVYPGLDTPQGRSTAYDDLSQALVSWGRSQAR